MAAKTPLEKQKKQKRQAAAMQALDGAYNTMTGAGRRLSEAGFEMAPLLSMGQIEELFNGNDLAHTICSEIVKDATKEVFEKIERDDDTADGESELAKKIQKRLEELDAAELLTKGATFGRAFGGGGLVLVVGGSGAQNTPLDLKRVKSIDALEVWDRQDMTFKTWEKNGDVRTYEWTPAAKNGRAAPRAIEVHASRVIRFEGAVTTSRMAQHNGGWSLSVLQNLYEILVSIGLSWASIDSMFSDASQAVIWLRGLTDALASQEGEGEQDVQTKLEFTSASRAVHKMMTLDAGDKNGNGREDFKTVDRGVLGSVSDPMQQQYLRLGAASRYPLTKLLGQSPSGMDATGEMDMIFWFNGVDAYRKKEIAPAAELLLRLVAAEQGEKQPELWSICWPELSRPKPLDVRNAELMGVNSLVSAVTAKILTPIEAAKTLPNVAPTMGIVVDLGAREAKVAEQLETTLTAPPEDTGSAENVTERTQGSDVQAQAQNS